MFSKDDTNRIKGIAILLLLFHHLFYSTSRIESNGVEFIYIDQNAVQGLAVLCRVCVWIFLFLSAYGLTYQFIYKKNISITKFIWQKWISLMLPFIFIYVCIAVIYSILVDNILSFYDNSILYLLLDMFGWADFFGTPMLLGAWWYMCIAQILIFMLPLFVFLCEKLEWIAIPACFILLQFINGGIQSNYGGAYANYLMAVVSGVLFAQKGILDSWKKKDRRLVEKVLQNCVVLILILAALTIKERIKSEDTYYLGGVLCAGAVIGISYIYCNFKTRGICAEILKFLGKHSGNIFMIHAFFYTYFPITVYWSHNFIVSWLCLILLGILSSYFVEIFKKVIHYNIIIQKLKNI